MTEKSVLLLRELLDAAEPEEVRRQKISVDDLRELFNRGFATVEIDHGL